MNPLVWLVVAIVAGAAAYLVAWPATRSYRSREARDSNAERYRAWRGQGRPTSPRASMREGMTAEERGRMVIGGLLAAVALTAVFAFFAAS